MKTNENPMLTWMRHTLSRADAQMDEFAGPGDARVLLDARDGEQHIRVTVHDMRQFVTRQETLRLIVLPRLMDVYHHSRQTPTTHTGMHAADCMECKAVVRGEAFATMRELLDWLDNTLIRAAGETTNDKVRRNKLYDLAKKCADACELATELGV